MRREIVPIDEMLSNDSRCSCGSTDCVELIEMESAAAFFTKFALAWCQDCGRLYRFDLHDKVEILTPTQVDEKVDA